MSTSHLSSFFSKNLTQIFLISFLILFAELSVIRYLSAEVISLAFFSSIILMACFFGIGLGCIFCHKKSWFNIFPFLFFVLVFFEIIIIYLVIEDNEMVMFQTRLVNKKQAINHSFIAMVIFSFVAILFYPLGQILGKEFTKSKKNIDAYLLDLSGSVFGVIFFAILSFFEIGVTIWIIIVNFTWLLIVYFNEDIKFRFNKSGNNKIFIMILMILSFAVLESSHPNLWWSKYYKIALEKNEKYINLFVNKTSHQAVYIDNNVRPLYYNFPYKLFKNPQYQNALIIGAGMGNDVDFALQNNVKNIDAVEIDERIYKLGKQFNPNHPYSDARVNISIDDGRSFLEKNQKKYDLIIFALTDSLTLASSQANTRLESYLYTKESFAKAKASLTENGLIVLYNHYRKDWIVDKIAGSLEDLFGQESIIVSDQKNDYKIIANGKKLQDFKNSEIGKEYSFYSLEKKSIKNSVDNVFPHDNWPFLYLQKPSFPNNYIKIVIFELIILGFLLIYLHKNHSKDLNSKPYDMLFLGIGFMLLETKNIINFQLLFGSTWSVNVLVILAILVTALIATVIIKLGIKFKIRNLYLAMAISILVSILVPITKFADYQPLLRYIFSCVVSFSPMLFASLIFSQTFSGEKKSALGFGYNMIGAMIGGILEYGSMIFGYHSLLYVIAVAYILALLTNYYRSKKNI